MQFMQITLTDCTRYAYSVSINYVDRKSNI